MAAPTRRDPDEATDQLRAMIEDLGAQIAQQNDGLRAKLDVIVAATPVVAAPAPVTS